MQGESAEIIKAVQQGRLEEIELPAKTKTLLQFVKLLTESSYRCSPEEVESLRTAGWTDPQISEVVLVTAMFAMFNRVADAFGLEDPNYFAAEPDAQVRPATEYQPQSSNPITPKNE